MRSLMFFVLAAAFVSCSSSQMSTQRVPRDLVICYAEGGGFTGQWSGAMISGDGAVHSWSPRMKDSAKTSLGTLPTASLEALWGSIERDGLLNGTSGGEAGNMTRVLSLTVGEKTVEVRWPYGTNPDTRTQPYAALYDRCRSAVANLAQ